MTLYHSGVGWVLYRVKHYVLCMGLENEPNRERGRMRPPLVTCKPQDIFAEKLPAQLTYPSWTTSSRGLNEYAALCMNWCPFSSKKIHPNGPLEGPTQSDRPATVPARPSQSSHPRAPIPAVRTHSKHGEDIAPASIQTGDSILSATSIVVAIFPLTV